MTLIHDNNKNSKTRLRQKQILDAALKVFLKKGFNGSTTKEIAQAAGVAEGTIFRYFKTKKDLLMAMAVPEVVESLAMVLEEVSGQSDEVVLKAILKNRLETVGRNKDLLRLLLTEAQFHPEIKEKFVEHVIMKAAGVLEMFMSERVEKGLYKKISPAISARAFVGMAGIFVLWRDFLQADKFVRFDDDTVIENIVDIFLNGLRKKPKKGEDADYGNETKE